MLIFRSYVRVHPHCPATRLPLPAPGLSTTPHGTLLTPVFAPVGTQATVKTLTPRDLRELGATLVLSNTYHLYLRPGTERVRDFGGLHASWAGNGPMLTDSGGFQVFSLAQMRKVDADGVTFRSHIDGSTAPLHPGERHRRARRTSAPTSSCASTSAPSRLNRPYNEKALERTHAWAARCKAAQQRRDQALFGIVQGGIFPDLRVESARTLPRLDFPGYAIGGLSVGETKEQMYATLDVTVPELPADKPRYLMGVGAPEDIVEGVARGIDIFDCVLPTRVARNGGLFTRQGRHEPAQRAATPPIRCRSSRAATATPARTSAAPTCATCSRRRKSSACTWRRVHNVRFMIRLMDEIRAAIVDGHVRRIPRAIPGRVPDYRPGRAPRAGDEARACKAQATDSQSAKSEKETHEHHPGHHPRHRSGRDRVHPGEFVRRTSCWSPGRSAGRIPACSSTRCCTGARWPPSSPTSGATGSTSSAASSAA